MIVKNEEQRLAKCLESILGFVDEIIIVDTGSMDATKEIAYRYTPNVLDFEWTQDFSAARNASIQKATGTWIIYLDADEFVDPLKFQEFVAFLSKLPDHKPTGIILPVYNYVGDNNSGKISESKAIRVFNNYQHIQFIRPIHEQLHCSSANIFTVEYPFPIYHTGYLQEIIESKDKSSRNMAIFETMLLEGTLSFYDWFTLGNEYNTQNRYQEALACYLKANQPSQEDKVWLPLCIGSLINCYIHLEDFSKAYLHIKSYQLHWPNACDFYWLEGFLLAKIGLDSLAIDALKHCIQLADSTEYHESVKVLISPNYASSLPLQQLTVLYMRNFAYDDAISTLSKLIYVTPNNKTLLKEFIQILLSFHQTKGLESLLHAFYPEPQPFQLLMILEVCIELGLKPLSESYRTFIKQKQIEIPQRLEQLYAILFEDKELFNTFNKELIDTDINYMSALAWGGSDLNLLVKELDVEILSQIYMRFFYAQQFDYCDLLVNCYNSPSLLNRLGDSFFRNRQYELALDYYSMLINQNALTASGYEHIGRLYIAQGDITDGLGYIHKAVELNPEIIVLQMILLNNSTDLEDHEHVKQAIVEKYPGLKDFPLI